MKPCSPSRLEAQALWALNRYRVERGLGPLRHNCQLARAAAFWLADAGAGPVSSRYSGSGLDFQRVLRCMPNPDWSFGYLHLFRGAKTVDELMRLWDRDADSREDLVDPALSEVGLAFGYGDRGREPNWVVITVVDTRSRWIG